MREKVVQVSSVAHPNKRERIVQVSLTCTTNAQNWNQDATLRVVTQGNE